MCIMKERKEFEDVVGIHLTYSKVSLTLMSMCLITQFLTNKWFCKDHEFICVSDCVSDTVMDINSDNI